MTTKPRLLAALTRADLLLGRAFELQVNPQMSLDELHGEVARSEWQTDAFCDDGIAAVDVEVR